MKGDRRKPAITKQLDELQRFAALLPDQTTLNDFIFSLPAEDRRGAYAFIAPMIRNFTPLGGTTGPAN